MFKFKIVLAGDKNVGKSSLLIRFCEGKFYEDLKDTIGVDFKRKKVDLNYDSKEISLELNIWDFGGEDKYRTLLPAYANGAAAAFILFDTTNKKSLYDIENWVKIITGNALENVVWIFIATKIDLKDQREVSKKEALTFFEKYRWGTEIFKTSSKTGENVEKSFLHAARKMIDLNLQRCTGCGDFFSKKLNYCTYCGEKIETEQP